MIEIVNVETAEQLAAGRKLLRDYEAWFGIDLTFQNFEREVSHLPEKYALPDGRFFVGYSDGTPAGCVGLRKLEDGYCEMKRLFVAEQFQGIGLGKMLIERLLEDAHLIGYQTLRLDTYPPKMAKAVEIYKSYGFREIPAYYHNPYKLSLFMEKDL